MRLLFQRLKGETPVVKCVGRYSKWRRFLLRQRRQDPFRRGIIFWGVLVNSSQRLFCLSPMLKANTPVDRFILKLSKIKYK